MSKKITLFFDNDRDNFIDKHLCKRVKPILIKESPIIPHPTLCFTNKSKYIQYLNRLSTPANIFASHIIRMYNLEIDSLDPKSGIDITHISYLINNISNFPVRQPFPIISSCKTFFAIPLKIPVFANLQLS